MVAADRNIGHKYGYKWIGIQDMTGWDPANTDVSLAAGAPALAEVITDPQISGMTVTELDSIHDYRALNDWYIDFNFGMDFRVHFADTEAAGNNDTVWTLNYLFLKNNDVLLTPIAATEAVTTTQTVATGATAGALAITPWAALATYTYHESTDVAMIWGITYTTDGDIANDAADLLGVEFRYTRDITTRTHESTTAAP